MNDENEIVESRPSQISLTLAEANELNAIGRSLASASSQWQTGPSAGDKGEFRSVIHCTFDGNRWQIEVANAIGAIQIGNRRIIVRPKIALAHVVHLFSRAGLLPRFLPSDVALLKSKDLFELIARWFVDALECLLRLDLVRDYSEAIDDLTAVRGQMDALETAQRYCAGRPVAVCRFDEFDLDTPLNRILKAAARRVAAQPGFAANPRRRAIRAIQRLDDVSEICPADHLARTDRRTRHYADAIMLGRLILSGDSRTIAVGDSRARVFLIPTPAAVEDGIRAVLRDGLARRCSVFKRSLSLGNGGLTITPDLRFDDRAVGDVKYKHYGEAWPRSDLYQAVAFASGHGLTDAAVISFAHGPAELPTVSFGRIAVRSIVWRTDIEPALAERELLGSVGNWLGLTAELRSIA